MGITIPTERMNKSQIIKLFSNPISGITCTFGPHENIGTHFYETNIPHREMENIRYSKSMLLGALRFWSSEFLKFYKKLDKCASNHMFFELITKITLENDNVLDILMFIEKLPDTFLFSHRYLNPIQPSDYTTGMHRQSNILSKKYNDIFLFQQGSLKAYKLMKTDVGIQFTVFPNEHPYIPKQKISRVGMTDKNNVYIIHKKEK